MIMFLLFVIGFVHQSFSEQHRVYYAEGMNGAVSCSHPIVAETAIKILKDGGNAVDAAVAAAFVLGVVDFSNSGIGGDGFALIYSHPNKIMAIDGSTKRPYNNITNEYKCHISLPALPEMLLKMLRLYGSKSAKEVLKPAITLCYKGFKITPYLANIISNYKSKIKDINALNLIAPNGFFLKEGCVLKQPRLGKTLERLSKDYGVSFYYGEDADKTLQDMKSKGSFYTKYDFMKYRSKLCKPIKINYKNYQIYGNPLPASSIASIKLLLSLLNSNIQFKNDNPFEILYQSYLYRNLLNEKYDSLSSFYSNSYEFIFYKTLFLSSVIDKIRAVDTNDSNTTHLCIWDKNNMVVSMTITLGSHFGTGQIAPGGFFYANSLRNYSKSVAFYQENYPNDYGPISSKSPIIITKNKEPWLSIGGAGADRIITNTATIIAKLMNNQDISNSIDDFRFFLDYRYYIHIEETEDNKNLIKAIFKLYPNVIKKSYLHDYFGLISVILRPSLKEPIKTVGDKHRDGSCLAY